MHEDVARFLRLPHHVEHHLFAEIKVEVNLHAALVRVAGHGVPVAAGFELCKPHAELAGLQYGRMDVLVYHQ